MSIIILGDLLVYELLVPPIQRKLVFDYYANNAINLCHPWHAFEMTEFTEIMTQKYQPFTELLSRVNDDDKAERNMTNNSINQYAKENKVTI